MPAIPPERIETIPQVEILDKFAKLRIVTHRTKHLVDSPMIGEGEQEAVQQRLSDCLELLRGFADIAQISVSSESPSYEAERTTAGIGMQPDEKFGKYEQQDLVW
ncbi:hypothetical protein CEP54_008983 [Fusarium duplospermum]|uniref:Uncharacterized protein n=1 Tax=Fusarium duplospermum TaxID=1325734 RepID=A0A428PT30_9HYPO|nr:hypothetical protein CEP54_008983 [Fusarium duplospermum]